MGGGGRRKSKPGSSNRNSSKPKSKDNRRRGGSSSSTVNIRSSLFVEGGFLSDWQLRTPSPAPSRGKNPSLSLPKSGSYGRGQSSGSRSVLRPSGNAFGYHYPVPDIQQRGGSTESSGKDDDIGYEVDKSEPIILLNSKETQIVAYLDEKPSMDIPNANVTYDYNSDFVLGEQSHRGLGFGGESEARPNGFGASSMQNDDQEEESTGDLLSSENEIDGMTEELMSEKSPAKKNSGFLAIGGMRLYTEDVSDEESNESEGAFGSESSQTEESDNSSESDDSEGFSMSGSDIDEDIVEDYLEGIGGRETLMDSKWLVDKEIDNYELDDSSSSSLEGTMEKLGGIALQDASREYGMKKPTQLNRKTYRMGKSSGSPAMDDLMLSNDMRSSSRRKSRITQLPQSWPLVAQKSKRSRNFPGEKKKHRKELIAVKRRDRMLRRGVDLEQINMKLEQIVLDGVDMYSFQPMHSRDCSQIRRLASIYQLQSGCQGSGKKRFVTVTRTHRTSMPSSSDKLRLEKLIGSFKDEADLPVVDVPNIKSGHRGNKTRKNNNSLQNSASSSSKKIGASVERSRKKVPLSSQPVAFVSSGIMESETVEIGIANAEEVGEMSNESKGKVGTFEEHTKGFGSRMMAKMGFVEGRGLGRDGKGMAEPIEVIKRPKSLGLGMNISESGEESERKRDPPSYQSMNRSSSSKKASANNRSQGIGAFERHTKGFGSKMMAKMGFVEGTGLGRSSQGITNPLVAVRLPKSRGLGATG